MVYFENAFRWFFFYYNSKKQGQSCKIDLGVWFCNRTTGFLLHAIHYSGVFICGLWKVMTRKDNLQLACHVPLFTLPDGGEITA
jgi:hypothetical protein